MATGTVYSTPARPLPRNSLSRGAFKFKKSPKHCSWKCTALIAVGIAVLLSVILCYCIGKAKEGGGRRCLTVKVGGAYPSETSGFPFSLMSGLTGGRRSPPSPSRWTWTLHFMTLVGDILLCNLDKMPNCDYSGHFTL